MAAYPCGYAVQPSQNWWKFGFPVFYVTNLLQIGRRWWPWVMLTILALPMSWPWSVTNRTRKGVGCSNMTMLADMGLFWSEREPNKWVTWRALRVLKAVSADE